MPSCVMRFCTNYSKKACKSQGITYHSFPSDELRRIQWVDIVRLQRSEEGWQPHSYSRICSLHFKDEDKYISAKGSALLKKSALPSRGEDPPVKKIIEPTKSNTAGVSAAATSEAVTRSSQCLIVSEKDAQPGPSKILDTRTPLDSGKEQDPLSRVIEQCRFCGEFSKDCVAVSSDMTYLASNKTTLALNDTSVQLDFNDRSLPKTVCRDCDAKLQEFCDFVNVVKAAQGTLINVAEDKEEFANTEESEETDVVEKAGYKETETFIIKTEYDSQPEDSDDDKAGIVNSISVDETVFAKETRKRKSATDTAKPKKLKSKEKCEDGLVINIKQEVVEKDANDGHGLSEASDTGTNVKPNELELATSALVFEMAADGTSEYKGYRSDR